MSEASFHPQTRGEWRTCVASQDIAAPGRRVIEATKGVRANQWQPKKET